MAAVLADEISGALSRFRWMSVVSTDAVAAALGPHRDSRAACATLDLDFLLDGQVQAIGDKVRLRASLIGAQEGSIVWTFKTDRDVADPLTFQDEVTAEIAARIDSHVLSLETQRAAAPDSSSLGPYGLVMQAVTTACQLDPATFHRAGDLLARARRINPNFAPAHIATAQFQMIAVSQGWAPDPQAALKEADEEAAAALAIDAFEAQAWTITGHVRSLLYREREEAIILHQRAMEINPNLPFAWHFAAANFLALGDLMQAKTCLQRHKQLGPSGVHFFGDSAIILLHLLEGKYEEAVRVARTTLRLHPNFVAAYKPYLAALGHLGLHSESRVAREHLLRLEPKFTVQSFLDRASFRRAEDRERYANGLRRAGL